MVVFCSLIYSYKNRTQESKQNNKWLIDSHQHRLVKDFQFGVSPVNYPESAAAVVAADFSIGFFKEANLSFLSLHVTCYL